MTDTPAWFEDEYEPRPRRRLVVVGAVVAVAWVVVAVLVFVLGGQAGDGATVGAATDTHRVPGPDEPGPGPEGAPVAPDGGTTPGDGIDLGATQPGPDAAAGTGGTAAEADEDGPGPDDHVVPGGATVSRDAAEAVATAVARAWLSDGGPDLLVEGVEVDRRAYLEHVTVEGFDLAGTELAVARLQLVLLLRDDDHYTEVAVRRAAVPLTLTAGRARPAGQPWFLPGVAQLETSPPATTPVEDPEVAGEIAEALLDAGYLHPEVREVAATADGSLAAQVHTITPEDDLVDGVVWLARTPDGLVLLGGLSAE